MQNVPRALRLCQRCDSDEVENLPHFLLRCSRYSVVRAQFSQLVHSVLDTVAFVNCPDQVAVAHAVVSMFRMVALRVSL